jgi:hypothetical protein
MNNTIKKLRKNGFINFAFGSEKLKKLAELDKKVFSVREDLILRIYSTEPDDKFTEEHLLALSRLENVKNLEINSCNNSNLSKLGDLKNLEKLILKNCKKLEIDFIKKLSKLKYLQLVGKIKGLEVIRLCQNLEMLDLEQLTINDFSFILPLKKLSRLVIYNSRVNCGFEVLQKTKLTELSLSTITNLSDVSFLSKMKYLKRLNLAASKVENLPNLKNLEKLESLELDTMKLWKNPEILKSIKNLKKLRLCEPNTKLKAEHFYFLISINSIKEIDYQFIDFHDSRRKKRLDDFFEKGNKLSLLKWNCCEHWSMTF